MTKSAVLLKLLHYKSALHENDGTIKWLNHSARSLKLTFQHITDLHLDHNLPSVTPLPVIDSLMEGRAFYGTSYHVAQLLMKWGQMGDGRHVEETGVWQALIPQSLPRAWDQTVCVGECVWMGTSRIITASHLMYLPWEIYFVHCHKRSLSWTQVSKEKLWVMTTLVFHFYLWIGNVSKCLPLLQPEHVFLTCYTILQMSRDRTFLHGWKYVFKAQTLCLWQSVIDNTGAHPEQNPL